MLPETEMESKRGARLCALPCVPALAARMVELSPECDETKTGDVEPTASFDTFFLFTGVLGRFRVVVVGIAGTAATDEFVVMGISELLDADANLRPWSRGKTAQCLHWCCESAWPSSFRTSLCGFPQTKVGLFESSTSLIDTFLFLTGVALGHLPPQALVRWTIRMRGRVPHGFGIDEGSCGQLWMFLVASLWTRWWSLSLALLQKLDSWLEWRGLFFSD